MKKISLIMIAVLCVSLLLSVCAFADGVVTIEGSVSTVDTGSLEEVDTETAYAGQKLTVKFSLANYTEGTPVNNIQFKVALPENAEYVADSAKVLVSDAASGGINYSAASNSIIFVWTNISSRIPAEEPDLCSFDVIVSEDALVGSTLEFTPVVEVFSNDTLAGETEVPNAVEAAETTIINTPTNDAMFAVAAVLMVALASAVVLKKRVNG